MNNQPPTTDAPPRTSKDVRLHIEHTYDQIQSFIAKHGNDRLRSRWLEWDERFQQLLKRADQRPEVAISLVGGTGAGKSTLLNALLGVRILPVGNMQVCTAAISEVAYADGPYHARIEFIPRKSWEKEVNLLLADLRDTQGTPDAPQRAPVVTIPTKPSPGGTNSIPDDQALSLMTLTALKTLATKNGVRILLGASSTYLRKQLAAKRSQASPAPDVAAAKSEPAAKQHKETAKDEAGDSATGMSRQVRTKLWKVYRPSETSDFSSFDPFHLVEPPEIKAALDAGFEEVSSSDVSEFRKQVARYLESKHRFWPIVKSVVIRGPFELLKDGAKIIDLPGINDPNESREAVTKEHLKTCRYVWLVFNIKRALTKDLHELIQSDDFMRQIVMDGRTDSLTFIGTASDAINTETGREEFGLREDAPKNEVIAARNREIRKVIDGQLDELSGRLAELAGEQPETASKLSSRLKASQIFTVSAEEYLRLCGLAKTDPAGLTATEQTEIPALIEHMQEICANQGVMAECQSLLRQRNLILAEIQGELQASWPCSRTEPTPAIAVRKN